MSTRKSLSVASFGLGLALCSLAACDSGSTNNNNSDMGTGDTGDMTMTSAGILPVDCTKTANGSNSACTRASSQPARTFGQGPSLKDLTKGFGNTYYGGFVDAANSRLVTAATWDSDAAPKGYIVAVDINNGNRTVLSGTYEDPQQGNKTVGTGPELGRLYDVQKGPNNMLYAVQKGFGPTRIFRIDPATGNRTQLWDSSTPNTARCNGSTGTAVYLTPSFFSLAVSDTAIYLGLSNNPAATGVGVAEVSIAGTTCKILSLSGNSSANAVNPGTGPSYTAGEPVSLTLSGGKLYYLIGQTKELVSVDPANGNRLRVVGPTVGTGPDLAAQRIAIDATKNTVYTVGSFAGNGTPIVQADLTTGNRTALLNSGPGGFPGEMNVLVHPSKPLLFLFASAAILLYDPATGNSNNFSY